MPVYTLYRILRIATTVSEYGNILGMLRSIRRFHDCAQKSNNFQNRDAVVGFRDKRLENRYADIFHLTSVHSQFHIPSYGSRNQESP